MHHFYCCSTTHPDWSPATTVCFLRSKLSRRGGLCFLAVLLFLSNRSLAQDWNQIIKTVASDRRTISTFGRGAFDYFGWSVAVDGDYAVIGANGEAQDADGGTLLQNAGSVVVFKRVNGTWTQIKKLVASDRGALDYFGWSVAISGGVIVVGATLEDHDATGGNFLNSAGSAYVFSQNEGGADNWGQVRKLVASDRSQNAQFGYSVSVNGSSIVVGALAESRDASGGNPINSSGAAYVFSKDQGGTGNWG